MIDSTPREDIDLTSTLASEIRTLAGRLKRRLREHGARGDFTPAQASVLVRLEKDGPATVSTLARTEGMRHQSMSAVVAALQQAKLVQGTPDPSDGRRILMSLTPRCLKLIQNGRAARQDWLMKRISQKLSIREQEKLRTALELLSRIAED